MLLKIQSIRESFRIIFPPLFSSFVLSRSFHTKIKLNSPIISHYFAFSPSALPIDNGTLSIDSISTREKYGRKKGKQFILDVKRWCHFIKNPQRKWNNVTTTNAVKISKKKSIIAQLLQIQLFAQRYCHVSLGFNNQLFIAKILSLL